MNKCISIKGVKLFYGVPKDQRQCCSPEPRKVEILSRAEKPNEMFVWQFLWVKIYIHYHSNTNEAVVWVISLFHASNDQWIIHHCLDSSKVWKSFQNFCAFFYAFYRDRLKTTCFCHEDLICQYQLAGYWKNLKVIFKQTLKKASTVSLVKVETETQRTQKNKHPKRN